MGRVVIQMKSGGIRELLNSSEVRDELTRRAERVLAKAFSDAPEVTGNYKRSLHIEQATTSRAVVRVVADAPHSHLVEANHGVLSRALDVGR